MNILAIDIGGTAIKYSLFTKLGSPITVIYEKMTLKTETDNSIMETVIEIIKEMQELYDFNGVAISTAGVVDAESGTVIFSGPTIPGYTNTPIKEVIEKATNIPCEVENDVNCAALGEFWKGAGKESQSLACVTLGTGVGGAIIMNGKLWKGSTHTAGEIGYLPLSEKRVLQDEASTNALIKSYKEKKGLLAEKINGKVIFNQAMKGDGEAIEAIDQMLMVLNQGLLAIVYLIAPDTIIIGGGIAAQKEYLEERIHNNLKERIIAERFMPKTIRCAQLGNAAGLIGAIYHFNEKHSEID